MPRIDSRLVYVDHVVGCGSKLFAAICASDLEGIVAKWKYGRYHSDGCTTSWLKVRNPHYSQIAGRPELFGARKADARSKSAKPVLCCGIAGAAIGAVKHHASMALRPLVRPRNRQLPAAAFLYLTGMMHSK
jgi:hypothetical protein